MGVAYSEHLPEIKTHKMGVNLGKLLLAAQNYDAITEKVRTQLDKILNIKDRKGPIEITDEEKEELIESVTKDINELIEDGELSLEGYKSSTKTAKTIRLKLIKLLHDNYLIDVRISEIEKNRKGLTSEEQLLRNQQLIHAIEVTKKSSSVRRFILKLTEDALASHYPPEDFNSKPLKKAGLSTRQINDLTTNFIFWTLKHDSRFNDFHRLIAYLYIFHGLDETTVHEKIKQFEEKDKCKYALNPETVNQFYKKIIQIFDNESDVLLNRFLSEASLKDMDNSSVIPNHDEYIKKITYFSKKGRVKPGTRPEILHGVEVRNINIPEAELEKTLDDIDIMLLQRGNISARNRALVRILRLIGYLVHSGFGQYMIGKYGAPEDFRDMKQEMAEKCLEKLAMIDPKKGRISTPLTIWLKALIRRYVYDLETVRNPSIVHDLAIYMKKHPNIPDKVLSNKYRISLVTIQKIRQESQQTYLSLDAPVNPNNSKETAFSEILNLDSSEDIEDLILRKQMNEVACRVLALLPPRDREILKLRREGVTLEDVSEEMGVSRERIRQIQEKALSNLATNNKQKKKFNFVSDETRFQEWCKENCKDPLDERMLRLRLGLAEENLYRKLGPTQIVKYLRSKGIYGLNRNSVSRHLLKLKRKLEKDQIALPEEERFVHVLRAAKCYRKARKILDRLRKDLDTEGTNKIDTQYLFKPNLPGPGGWPHIQGRRKN